MPIQSTPYIRHGSPMSALKQSLERVVPPSTISLSLYNLLQSNDPPIESEIRAVKDIILIAERRLVDVEEEMTRLEDALDQLRCQRDDARRIIDSHRAILSPIRRLPRELIAEIALKTFLLENDDNKYADWPVAATLDTRSSPWKLGQICRIWRDAVLSFPTLWTSLRIDGAHKSSNLEYVLDTYLQRSKDLPLSLIFVDGRPGIEVSPQLMKILARQCHRWKNLNLTLELYESFEQLAAVKEHLPILERLQWYPSESIIDAYFDDFGMTVGEDLEIHLANNPFALAPNLRSFTTNSSNNPRHTLSFPLLQLKYYEQRDYLDFSPEVLSQLRNLVDCVLLGGTLGVISVAFELPHLRTLRASTSVLGLLTTPAIEALDVDATYDVFDPFEAFLTRSHCCALKSFSITGELLLGLPDILQSIPSLTSLRIWDGTYDSDLICSLVFNASGPPLLPKLETLTMVVVLDPELAFIFEEEPLFQMVESRWNPTLIETAHSVTRLTTFLFSIRLTPHLLSADSLQRLNELQVQGLRIVLDIAEDGKLHGDFDREMRENWPFDYVYPA